MISIIKGSLKKISGICTCLKGFGGSDCSFDTSSPPFISRISGNGLCDKSTEPCDETTIYGKYFVSNPNASCVMKRAGVINNYTILCFSNAFSLHLFDLSTTKSMWFYILVQYKRDIILWRNVSGETDGENIVWSIMCFSFQWKWKLVFEICVQFDEWWWAVFNRTYRVCVSVQMSNF